MSVEAISTKTNGRISVKHINVKTQRSRKEGQCFTLSMDKHIRNLEIRRVKIIGYGFYMDKNPKMCLKIFALNSFSIKPLTFH